MNTSKNSTNSVAAIVAATTATTTAITTTPKAGINNTYSQQTTAEKIIQLQELLKVTMESLDDKQANLHFIDWTKMKEGPRTKTEDYKAKVVLLSKHTIQACSTQQTEG
jgi:hypothetical protein